jgi:Fic/DOC family protein
MALLLKRDRMDIVEQVAESLRIEGIVRPPTEDELTEHRRFTHLETLSISELEAFLKVFRPGARLRLYPGQDDIRVGSHVPPKSGEHIAAQLNALLVDINAKKIDAWSAHLQFETLHPFSDGNGRLGRSIWNFSMKNTSRFDLGFLHGFYLQTLNKFGTNAEKFLIQPELATNAKVEWPDVDLAGSDYQRLDARSFAMHRLVAAKLLANPALITQARGTLERWRAQAVEPIPPYFLEWGQVLAGSLEEIVDFLLSTGKDATRLRQSSPFTDILTPEERAVIY